MTQGAQGFSNGGVGEESSFGRVGLPWRLLVFSILLFGFSVFIFLGLRLGYGTYLDGQSKRIDSDAEALASTVSDEEQEGLVTFYSQLVNIEKVLSRHNFTSNNFSFLEKATVPNVYYTGGSFSVDGFSLVLQGEAQSFDDLIGQLTVFDGSPEVEETVLERMGLDGATVGFSVRLKMKESYFGKIQ